MHLLDLPREIRDHIFSYILSPGTNRRSLGNGESAYNYAPALRLLQVNRQVYREAHVLFWDLNTFVHVSSPFGESADHVANEGVHIIATGATANRFTKHRLSVLISFPLSGLRDSKATFITLVDDLPKFCTSWFYSCVDFPELNPNLTLKLTLRDPLAATPNEKRVSTALQRRLLLPFGRVKELMRVDVTGVPEPEESVVEELKKEMAIPMDSPEQCLANSTRLKDEGNAELQAGCYSEALECYRKAWFAMHIIVKGRDRVIHGERFFNKLLMEPPFENQEGGVVRLVLRIRLVANTLLAYLKLQDYDMLIFTGMRTIKIMRLWLGLDEDEGAGEPNQEAMTDFVAPGELGKIYFRTAMGYKARDDKYEARRLLKVAAIYLPNDRIVAQEMSECALRIL